MVRADTERTERIERKNGAGWNAQDGTDRTEMEGAPENFGFQFRELSSIPNEPLCSEVTPEASDTRANHIRNDRLEAMNAI